MGQKFIPELHDPNYRKAEGQKDEQLTEDEAEQLFDAMIAKLDAEDRSARDVNRTFAVSRRRRFSNVSTEAERVGIQGRQDSEPGQRAARYDTECAARPLYESADQKWMIRLFPFI